MSGEALAYVALLCASTSAGCLIGSLWIQRTARRMRREAIEAMRQQESARDDCRLIAVEMAHNDHVHLDFYLNDQKVAALVTVPLFARQLTNSILREGMADSTVERGHPE